MSYDFSSIGNSIIVSAPSGAGKTTIVRRLMENLPVLAFSISACSREPRPNEINGKDYYFMGLREFKKSIQNEAFVEWEEVYKDHYYGTLKSEVKRLWEGGKAVIFDVDVVGGLNLKHLFKDQALSLFIAPPSISILEQRLRSRETESEDRIAVRVKKALWEMSQAENFDVQILNQDLEEAVFEATQAVKQFLKI